MNPFKIIILGLISFTMFGANASAASVNDGKKHEDPFGPNRFFGAVGWNKSDIKMNDSTSFSATESGDDTEKFTHGVKQTFDINLWNGWLGYEYNRPWATYFFVRGVWGGGSGDHENLHAFTHNTFIEGRLGYQFTFGNEDQFSFTPYAGYSYIQNQTRLNPQSVSFITEDGDTVELNVSDEKMVGRKQNISVGAFLNYLFMDKFSVGLNAQAMINVQARLKTSTNIEEITVISAAGSDPFIPDDGNIGRTDSVNSNVDWLFELPIMYHLDSAWDFSLVPFYSWSNYKIDKHSVTNSFTENSTGDTFTFSSSHSGSTKVQDWGLRFEVGFRF
jgi:hypothetical protein